MPGDAELLLGRIALKNHYVSRKQLDEALRHQASTTPVRPLGVILLEQKSITFKELNHMLRIQRGLMRAVDPLLKKTKEAILFGRLVVREKLATPEKVNECLRLQEHDIGGGKTLGEIMVECGHLAPADVRRILAMQQKRTMRCGTCKLTYTVTSTNKASTVPCPGCQRPLVEQKGSASTRTDAEFGTLIARSVDIQLQPPPVSHASSSEILLKTRCFVCTHTFVGALDSADRIRCPRCLSVFKPRRK